MSDKAIVHTLCRNSVNVSKSGNDKINKARDLLQESTGSFFLKWTICKKNYILDLE